MLQKIGEQAATAITVTIILGVLTLIWQALSDGGIVRFLGGVTEGDIPRLIGELPEEQLQGIIGHPHGETKSDGLPANAIIAIDAPGGCPQGWAPFAEAQGRLLLGATNGAFAPGLDTDDESKPISSYKYRQHGGSEHVTLQAAQLAAHNHALQRRYAFNGASGPNSFRVNGELGIVQSEDAGPLTFGSDHSGEMNATETSVEAAPHNNMPPYIALYFCKKD